MKLKKITHRHFPASRDEVVTRKAIDEIFEIMFYGG